MAICRPTARHGLDWDHLSAIADLVGSPGTRNRRSLGLALWYCIGHGAVIVLLGALVGLLGVRLPGGLDRVFEVVVGLTLVGLGIVVLVQVGRQGRNYRFTSRWRLLLDLGRRVWLRRRGKVAWDRPATRSRRGRPSASASCTAPGPRRRPRLSSSEPPPPQGRPAARCWCWPPSSSAWSHPIWESRWCGSAEGWAQPVSPSARPHSAS
jgi:hypothetical protein